MLGKTAVLRCLPFSGFPFGVSVCAMNLFGCGHPVVPVPLLTGGEFLFLLLLYFSLVLLF